jgi:hypothetical protein
VNKSRFGLQIQSVPTTIFVMNQLAIASTSRTTSGIRINKAVQAIHIAPRKGHLTLVMRKLYNVLLKLAGDRWRKMKLEDRERLLQEMREKATLAEGLEVSPAFTFRCKLSEITRELGYDRRNAKIIYSSLRELRACEVQWNMMLDGGEETFISGLLSEATIARGGAISWSYGINLFEMLLDPRRYQEIDLALQKELRSYAALALYENTIRYAKVGSTGFKSIAQWRELLSADGRVALESTTVWKKRLLKPAIEELHAASQSFITLTFEEQKGERGKVLALRFKVHLKPIESMFEFTPISHDQKLVAQLRDMQLTQAQLSEVLSQHEPAYILGNLDYVKKMAKRGGVTNLRAYVLEALSKDFRPQDVKAAEQMALVRKEQALAEESKQLESDFAEFQAKRLREKFMALSPEEQRARFYAFIDSKVVTQPELLRLIEENGLEVLQARTVNERSVNGSFFTWLRTQHPPLLTTHKETDKYVFAGMRRANKDPKPETGPE